jgi:hypothetical protein
MSSEGVVTRAAPPPLSLRALTELAEHQGVHPDVRDLEAVLGTLCDLAADLARLETTLSLEVAGQ